MTPPSASLKQAPKEYLEIYSLYRERVSQEDNLVNHRMGWMLLSNAIFFGFFAALIAALSNDRATGSSFSRFSFVPTTIALFGIICTGGSIISIHAALDEIDYLHDIYRTMYPEIGEAERMRLMPSLVGHKNYHFFGTIVPRLMPWGIILLWVALIIFQHMEFRW